MKKIFSAIGTVISILLCNILIHNYGTDAGILYICGVISYFFVRWLCEIYFD